MIQFVQSPNADEKEIVLHYIHLDHLETKFNIAMSYGSMAATKSNWLDGLISTSVTDKRNPIFVCTIHDILFNSHK